MRILHAAIATPFDAISKVMARELLAVVKSIGNICVSTQQFVAAMDRVVVSSTDRMGKIDVEGFFLQGKHYDLARLATEQLHGSMRKVFEDALNFVLSNQFIKIDQLFVRMTIGSSMGSIISSALCDLAFYALAEKGIVDNKVACEAAKLAVWLRYRDDIFVVYREFEPWRRTFESIKMRASKIWSLEVEEINRYKIDFLDVTMFKGRQWSRNGILDRRPFVKPSSRAAPLGVDSAHPKFTQQWVLANVSRLANNSSSRVEFCHAKLQFMARLETYFFPNDVLRKVANKDPWASKILMPNTASLFEADKNTSGCVNCQNSDERIVSLVLHFHPAFHNIVLLLDSHFVVALLVLPLFGVSTCS